MLRALLAHRVRGQALSELQVAILVGAIVLAAFVFLFARQVAASAAVNTYAANEAAVVSFFKESEDDAAAAQAVFSPGEDVGGNSNADGHAADVYQQDAAHVGHFFEMCFKASSNACPASQPVGTLQRYAYSWSNLPQNGGSGATTQSSPITLFSGFTFRVLTTAAQYADSTLNPYAYAYFTKHPANFTGAKTYHWGFPGVTSSTNDLYVMTVTLPNGEKRSVAFGKHHIVFAQDVIYGTATPTPNPMCAASCPQNSASLTFRNPIDASQNETLLEANYGTRSTNPAQVYTVSGCTGTATFSPVSPVTPATDGSGSATLTIAPVKQLAPNGLTCTITAKDNADQSIPIAVSIGKTYAPTSSGPAAGLSGQNGTFSVNEANYNTSPTGGFSASLSGACNSITRTSASLDGTFTESETWSVHFASTGGCTVVFTDVYGQSAQNVTNVACSSYGTPCALNVSPTAITIYNPPGGSGEPISAAVGVSESNQSNAFTINDSGCRGSSYATASASSISSGGGTFTITAGSSKTPPNASCAVVVSDGNGQSATINVTVDPDIVATPTPAPTATPALNPCSAANSCWVVGLQAVVCQDSYCQVVGNAYSGTLLLDSSFTQTPNMATTGYAMVSDSGFTANNFVIDSTYCNNVSQPSVCSTAPPSQIQTCMNNLLNSDISSYSAVETWAFWAWKGHISSSSSTPKIDFMSTPYNLDNIMQFNHFVSGVAFAEQTC